MYLLLPTLRCPLASRKNTDHHPSFLHGFGSKTSPPRSTVLLRYLAGISTQNISRTNISRISQPTPKISQPKISQAQKNISRVSQAFQKISQAFEISQAKYLNVYKYLKKNISTLTNISRISQENISRIGISQGKYLKHSKYLKQYLKKISQA